MYSKGIFGEFYPIKSIMHKLNSSVKLICFFIGMLALLFSSDLTLHALFLVMVLFLTSLSEVPFKYFFKNFYSLRYVYVLTVIICFLLGASFNTVLIILIRIISLVLYLSLISYTTSVSELSYAVGRILEPFNLFNLKLGKVTSFITNTIKFYPTFVNNNSRILRAQASRGIDYSNSSLSGRIFALTSSIPISFKKTINDFKQINLECNMHLFNTKRKRSNINYNKFGFYDIILLALHFMFLVAYILEAGLIG